MAIADTIQSMYENVGNVYNTITNVTPPEHKNIENIPSTIRDSYLEIMNNGIDKVWDSWEKVEDTGTSLTLSDTEYAPMKVNLSASETTQETITGETGTEVIDTSINATTDTSKESYITLRGNTYQYQTTGKNLIGTNYITGVTINDTITNDITIRGNWASTIVSNENLLNILEPSTTYTISYKYKILERPSSFGTNNSVYILGMYNGGSGLSFFGETRKNTIALNTWETITKTFTTPSDLSNYRLIAYDFKDTDNTTTGAIEVSNLQIERGNTATSYEPYTNGTSPNPDYPQNIEVVTGDNTINVCGKNLINTIEYSREINSSGVISGVDTHYLGIKEYVSCKPSTTYTITFEHDISTLSLYIGYKDKDGNFLNRVSTSLRTFTTPNNAYYMFVYVYKDDRFDTAGGYVQLEYGDTATTYEPYTGESYEVNLGKNLIYNANHPQDETYQGIAYKNNSDGSISVSGTATGNYNYYLMNNFVLQPGTYTLSGGISNKAWVRAYDGTNYYDTTSGNVRTFTITKATSFNISLRVQQDTTIDGTFYPMLERGSQATTYAKYFEPIELCKIGNYQDRIYKSGDKWYKKGYVRHLTLAISDMNNSDEYPGWINQTELKNDYTGLNTNLGSVTDYVCNIGIENEAFSIDSVLVNTRTSGIVMLNRNVFHLIQTQWIATYPNLVMELYYGLQTPYEVEITDTTLISQLDALYKATTYSTTNINTSTNNLLPYIDFKYNVVTPSPSPDRPSEVKVVNGDNEIGITGKNLCDIENLDKTGVYATYTYSNGTFTMTPTQSSNNGRLQFIIPKKYFVEGETYTISATGPNKYAIGYASNVGDTSHFNYFRNANNVNELSFTYTSIPTDYVCFYLYNNNQILGTNWTISNIQIEKGNIATTYEPYVSSSYQVNLGVENILPISQITSQTINGLTITNLEDGTIKVNGTSNTTTRVDVTYSKTLKANTTYTWHNFNTRSSGANVNIQDSGGNVLSNIVLNSSTNTYTPTTDVTITTMRFYIDSNQTFSDYILKVQLEEGNKSSSFTPYGTTPIELCKIGDYQDRFIRNSGKNLLEPSSFATSLTKNGITYTNNGDGTFNLSGTASANTTIEIIPNGSLQLEANQSYYLYSSVPYNGTTFNMSIPMTDNGTTKFLLANNTYTPTTTPTNERLQFYLASGNSINVSNVKMMLVKGNVAPSQYEPYGTNEWYLEKKIQKTTLTSENLQIIGNSFTTAWAVNGLMIEKQYLGWKIAWDSRIALLNNYSEIRSVSDVKSGAFATNFNMASIVLFDDRFTDLTTARSLAVGTEIYIPKATPTYTKIEGTLKEQLESVWRAKSYKTQTNINQINNDLPFEINAIALRDFN